MHDTAIEYGKLFFENYLFKRSKILDVGSLNMNGSLKSFVTNKHNYIGIDMTPGKDVDVVQEDPYKIPFKDNFFDVVISTSVFEHAELFWLLSNEIFRVLKPDGLFYMNAPSNGIVHRYPVDCWRFYPDAGDAIVKWGVYSGYKNLVLLESFTGKRNKDIWNDYCCVFLKDKNFITNYPNRIVFNNKTFTYDKTNQKKEKMINDSKWVEDATIVGMLKTILYRFKSFFIFKVWLYAILKKIKIFYILRKLKQKFFS